MNVHVGRFVPPLAAWGRRGLWVAGVRFGADRGRRTVFLAIEGLQRDAIERVV
jgi:hypothetical protein